MRINRVKFAAALARKDINCKEHRGNDAMNRARYFRTCPTCGAALDPGEVCEDCRGVNSDTYRNLEEKAADADDIDDGEVQGDLTGPLHLHDNKNQEE